MPSPLKIVPVQEFDLARHERAIAELGGPDDRSALEAVKRGLAELTPVQRLASRVPTPGELRRILAWVAEDTGHALTMPPADPMASSWWATFDVREDDVLVSRLRVDAQIDDDGDLVSYTCDAHADLLRALAARIANVAGPQVTFLAEGVSPAELTALYVATTTKKGMRS